LVPKSYKRAKLARLRKPDPVALAVMHLLFALSLLVRNLLGGRLKVERDYRYAA
jgi:hypothetical protein